MKKFIISLLLLAGSFSYSAPSKNIQITYTVNSGAGDKAVAEKKLKSLDLGEEIKAVKISGLQLKNIIVEQRFRTSMSVQNEGPHLDFIDWKHDHTDWTELENEDQKFVAVQSPPEKLPFPEMSQQEILDYFEVYKKEKKDNDLKHWNEVVKKCTNATTYPCRVGIDRVEFQIKDRKSSKVLKSFHVLYPMGC